MASVCGSDRSRRTAWQRAPTDRSRRAGSPSPTGTVKRINVMRLPPIGSASVRMLIGSVTRSSSTVVPCRAW